MAIPPAERSKILEAMNEFDSTLLPTDEWRDWQNNRSQLWALKYEGRLYPPKKIISLATGLPVGKFSGGPEAIDYLEKHELEVIRLRQFTLDSVFKLILERYDEARKSIEYAGNHEIKEFFDEAGRIIRVSSTLTGHPNINVVTSYGKGDFARIPWISLLDKRETETTQAGIYIVYLFEEGGKGVYLKLAQGVALAQKEYGAKAKEALQENAGKIRVQCSNLASHGFDLSGKTNLQTDSKLGKLYEASTIAAKRYSSDAMPSEAELFGDLKILLSTYDGYVINRDSATQPILDQRRLALIGTWRSVADDAEEVKQKIQSNGGWASWWSFTIKEEAQPRLSTPFNLYAYTGNGILGAKLRVAEYKTSRGNGGLESPWPELTDERWRGTTRVSNAQSGIFKTWFRIDRIEVLDPPMVVSAFDISPSLSTAQNVLNQNTFGYVYDRDDDVTSYSKTEPLLEISLDWLAQQTGLSSSSLQEMITALRTDSPQIILAGPPGTGKTWVARQLAHYLTRGNPRCIRFVQFHPSYTYESFMEGLRPVTRNGGISFEVTNGLVLDCVENMRRCGDLNNPAQDHVIVIDEANRANLPKVLGELMFLFEYRQQSVRLQYSGDFLLPANLRFIATMNTADRSIRSIDVALRRRFDVFELRPDPEILRKYYENNRPSLPGLVDGFVQLNQMLESELDRHHTIGHTFFMRSEMGAETLRKIWTRRVFPLIEEFFFDQPQFTREFSLERFWPAANGA
ncbi:MrcB family domain-containing protein [Paraburkholderia acidiphila]|nr:DUF3578 domain-containing protein [Paraburkholderia acidiphila]